MESVEAQKQNQNKFALKNALERKPVVLMYNDKDIGVFPSLTWKKISSDYTKTYSAQARVGQVLPHVTFGLGREQFRKAKNSPKIDIIGLTIRDAEKGKYTVEQMEVGFFVDKQEYQDWKKANVQIQFTLRAGNGGECPDPFYRTKRQLDNMTKPQRFRCLYKGCFGSKKKDRKYWLVHLLSCNCRIGNFICCRGHTTACCHYLPRTSTNNNNRQQ